MGRTALLALTLTACGSEPVPDCNRDCLIALTNTYLAAVVAHDPSSAPLADDIAFVENVTRMEPGAGLWATAVSGPTNFAIHVPEVTQQQAGFMGVMARQGANGNENVLIAVRLKVENGMITAGPTAGSGPGADPNRAPVANLCGPQLSSKSFTYIDRIENRRLIAADPVTGLSMGFSHFRHPMDNLPFNVIHTDGSTSERNSENFNFNPFDMPAAHIFKSGADGLVHEIEAVGITTPLNSPTGWE